ncbi:hypothetical protein JTB14_011358 [Gonioctena quinquepunctata]|nr:hypothetical protein JTB14_011358 [Gonioctena quinquepunctata]
MEWVRKSKDLLQSDLKLVKFQEWLKNLADDVCQLQNPFPSNSKYEQKQVTAVNSPLKKCQLESNTSEISLIEELYESSNKPDEACYPEIDEAAGETSTQNEL